jgi:uncharacterized protein
MSNNKYTLVLGASDNPERYSYLAVNSLRKHGHSVAAVGRKKTKVADVEVENDPRPFKNIDTVTLYLNEKHQKEYYDYIFSLQPERIIFNPGAENDELFELAKQKGINVTEACTLVLLSTNQY